RRLGLSMHAQLHPAGAREGRIRLGAMARDDNMDALKERGEGAPNGPVLERIRAYFADAAGTAARYLARPDGPRVGALAFNGWDTHINEGIAVGLLANLFGALDGAFHAVEIGVGNACKETVVAVLT